jgi:hypothetical protein
VQVPPVIQSHYDNLPLTTQQRLKGMSDVKIDPLKVPRGYLGGPIFGLIVGICGVLATYFYTYEGIGLYRKMSDDEAMTVAIMSLLSGAFLVGCILSIRRRKSAPVKSFWYVHPSYLIDADFGNITAYPLLHLNDVKLTHHITNGVYQYTDIAMNFTGRMLNINYPGKEASAQLAKAMLGYSDKVRALAAQNNLESAPEHNLFLTGGSKPAPSGPKWYLEWLAAGIASGVMGYIFLPALHNQAADHHVFEDDCENARPSESKPDSTNVDDPYRYDYGSIEYGCTRYIKDFPDGAHLEAADDKLFEAAKPTIRKLEDYKLLLPNGRHIKDVDPAIAALYDQANAKYKGAASSSVDPIAPEGIKAMGQVIETLRDNKSTKVYIHYSNFIDFEGKMGNPLHGTLAGLSKKYDDITFDPVESSFTDELNSRREQKITDTLTKTFGDIIPEEIMRFEVVPVGAEAPADAVVVFDINFVIFPAPDAVFTSKTNKNKGSFDVRFDWTFTIKLPKKPEVKPFVFTTTSIAPDDLRGDEGETTLYGAMASTVFVDFGEHLKLIFGFPGNINKIDYGTELAPNGDLPLDLPGKKGKKNK